MRAHTHLSSGTASSTTYHPGSLPPVRLPKPPRRLFRRLLKYAFLLAVGYQLWFFAQVLWLTRFDPASSAFMDARLSTLRADDPNADLSHRWVDYSRISTHLKRAVIASEDARFQQHSGFDWEGIQVALEKNRKKGKFVAGGSTISQQLAKNLFLSGSRTPWRKGQEAAITVMLESTMDKRRILELYLNVAEWGDGVYGAEAAARHYFKTSAAQLGPAQAAKLAAMLPRPRYYDDHRWDRRLMRKASIIQKRMRQVRAPS